MPGRPRRVALTGGIATGKSTCLAEFVRLGAAVIDADALARDVVAPGTPGLGAVTARFGPTVVGADGLLDRDELARRVFVDREARRDLEAIIHPMVYEAIARWFATLTAPVGIADIPLLFETGHAHDFDVVIVAACTPAQQLARLMARNALSEHDARARIAAQWPIEDKVAKADYVIDTSGMLSDTHRRTREVWATLSR